MRIIFLVIAITSFLSLPALAMPPEAGRLLDQAAEDCRGFENGTFDPGDAVTTLELGSQYGSVEATLIDESKYGCSSAASLYCGSGGCMLNLVINGTAYAWQAIGWRVVEWGPDRVFLIARDGGWCGGAGAEVCYEAVVWSGGRLLTVGEVPESR